MPGGVCAVLDYEVETMAEYVAEMAMRVVMPNAMVTAQFRKFVSQILTSTRLPSTTILLGMNYLSKRVNMLTAQGGFKPSEGQVWRMLTVSLLLGSKFLDDNTFQNRSWSEVSGIAVQELNSMENEWLRQISWSLYVNLDKSNDYTAWLNNWKEWQADKQRDEIAKHQQAQAAAVRERLCQSLESMQQSVYHPLAFEGWTPEEIYDYEHLRASHNVKAYRPRESSWPCSTYQNTWPTTPLTPPDSGYGTPEYMNSVTSMSSRFEWFNSTAGMGYSRGYHPGAAGGHSGFGTRCGSHYPQHAYYGNYGHTGIWDSSAAECNCAQCLATVHKPHHYFQHNGFGQPVMG